MYTTYFYTAGEAIVQGYENDTHVRIVTAQGKKGTIWEGTVHRGDAKLVPTGMGVFGFLSDKKATILVGTPNSCTVVGYFAKDQNGAYRSDHFFLQLPAAASNGAERVVLWAYEDTEVEVRSARHEKTIATAKLKAGTFLPLIKELNDVAGATLEIKASKSVAAQVYFDEGFIVPADNGRGAGKTFFTYVGTLTDGTNDLDIGSQQVTAHVVVTDLVSGETLFKGEVPAGTVKTINMADKYVKVTSDASVTVTVAATTYPGYAEHHFAAGLEGGLIENDFLVTTSGELWLFSYYDGNEVKVTDSKTGKAVHAATLNAGGVAALKPGNGVFRVRASKGLSAMGGASACGADYSPGGGLFAMDEAVLEVVAQIRDQRVRDAAEKGVKLSADKATAPVSAEEWSRYQSSFAESYRKKNEVKGASAPAPAPSMSLDEFNQRAAAH
jgi:hypothetical protein